MAINVLTETPQAVAEALAPASAGTIVEIVEYHRHRIAGLEAALRRIASMDYDGPQHLAIGWAAEIAEEALSK